MGFHTLATDGSEKTTPSSSSITSTTTGNIDNLDFLNADLIRMNNATDATIRGLLAGVDGQRVTIVSIGAGNVLLAHQNTNSSAANRLINFLTTFTTPLAAGVGAATLQYDATTARWRLIDHAQGDTITIAYASGNFKASTGTWTVDSGDVTTLAYFFTERMCDVQIVISTTTISATPTNLQITIPMTPAQDLYNPARMIDIVTAFVGLFRVVNADPTIYCYKDVATNAWSTTTNNSGVQGSIRFRVA